MRPTVTEVLRRAFDNVVANWPLLLIRFAESAILAAIVIGGLVATIVPIALSFGLTKFEPPTDPEGMADLMLMLLRDYWYLVLLILAVLTVLTLVAVAVHSFFEAGSARVYVDGERAAGPAPHGPRSRFRAFTGERWMSGGKAHWLTIFWIFNGVWGVGGLILLVPLLIVLALMVVLRGTPEAAVAVGCLALALTILASILVGIAVNLWGRKAIVIAVRRGAGAKEAISAGWRELWADAGRHLGVALVMIAISFGAALFFMTLSIGFALDDSPLYMALVLPFRVVLSLVNTVFSAAVAGWFLAAFAALTGDRA